MMVDWHVTSLQLCSRHVWSLWLGDKFPELFGILVTPQKLFPRDIHLALKMINNDWLERGLLGGPELTIGDMLCFHELITLNLENHNFGKYPKVIEYMNSCIQKNPDFLEGLKDIKKRVKAKGHAWLLNEASL
jgi:glutathione S-transferase